MGSSPHTSQNFSSSGGNYNSASDMRMSAVSLESTGGASHADLLLQLEERNLELEQRNVLLSKAKVAMDNLKRELKGAREENGNEKLQLLELEQRVTKMKSANEEIDRSCKEQILGMEKEVVAAKGKVFVLEESKNAMETKTEKLELELAHSEDRLKEVSLISLHTLYSCFITSYTTIYTY